MKRFFVLRSLGAKLALLMICVATITAGSMTYLSATRFSDYIIKTIEDSVTTLAERTATDMSATLEKWISESSVTVSKVSTKATNSNSDSDEDLSAALRNNKDILALALFQVEKQNATLVRQATQATSDSQQTKINDISKDSMAKIAGDIAKNENILKDGRLVKNLMPETKMPLFIIVVKFVIPDHPEKYALMTIVGSMTSLQVALPQSRSTIAYILDYKGSMFVSTDEQAMRERKPVFTSKLIERALSRKSPAGFLDRYKAEGSKEKAGSFAQLPGKIPLIVIIEKDRSAAFQDLNRMYLISALSCVLILLVVAMISYTSVKSVTSNLQNLAHATGRIAGGDLSVRLQPTTNDEVAHLSLSVNSMAEKIQQLIRTTEEKGRQEGELAKELETARTVQSTFFPKHDITVNNLFITGNYQPATQCGGDLWGHFSIRQGVELVFIADAMGHGVPAALVTAIAAATCQSVASILKEQGTIDTSASALLRRLNNIILDAVDGKISMTFFAAIIDFNAGKLSFSNAGHNFPLIVTNNKTDARLGKSVQKAFGKSPTAAITLTLQGTPLGIAREAEFSEKTIDIAAGDKIFFFTDGLIENSKKDAAPLGRKMLVDYICQIGESSPDAIKRSVLQKGIEVFGSENLPDDVTVVVAEISKEWVKKVQIEPTEAASPTISTPMPEFKLSSIEPVQNQESTASVLPDFELKVPG
jgi:serine phosphatase RsbU (regulator of sigma subunit)